MTEHTITNAACSKCTNVICHACGEGDGGERCLQVGWVPGAAHRSQSPHCSQHHRLQAERWTIALQQDFVFIKETANMQVYLCTMQHSLLLTTLSASLHEAMLALLLLVFLLAFGLVLITNATALPSHRDAWRSVSGA